MMGIGLSSQAYNSWARAALSWALLGAPNGEAAVQASDQQGAPVGQDLFANLSNPFCR